MSTWRGWQGKVVSPAPARDRRRRLGYGVGQVTKTAAKTRTPAGRTSRGSGLGNELATGPAQAGPVKKTGRAGKGIQAAAGAVSWEVSGSMTSTSMEFRATSRS